MREHWFGPSEMAKRLGITPKALRIYETAGLIKPARTQTGWRTYGPAEQARLHQVLTLKRLGLTLARIGELISGKLSSLEAFLELQQKILESRKTEAEQALKVLAAAREKLARCGVLSPDDLLQLTRETTMTDKDNDWREVFEPLVEKHFSPEEMQEIGLRKKEFWSKSGYNPDSFKAAFASLQVELRALFAVNDIESPRALEFVRRWNGMMTGFTQFQNADQAQRGREAWEEAASTPETAARMPIRPEEFAFVQRIADGMRMRGELPPR